MTLLVQISKGNVCAGGIVRNGIITVAAPYLWKLKWWADDWPTLRNRLLHKGYSIWEKKL